MKKVIILVAIVAIIVIGIVTIIFNSNKKEAQVALKKVKVNEVTRSVFYAPQYVAISQGFFKEKGLDIELTTGQGADKVMTAVLARSK